MSNHRGNLPSVPASPVVPPTPQNSISTPPTDNPAPSDHHPVAAIATTGEDELNYYPLLMSEHGNEEPIASSLSPPAGQSPTHHPHHHEEENWDLYPAIVQMLHEMENGGERKDKRAGERGRQE
ncbi:hypothetical protein BC938DRAFT_476989 [Jimgerdemannia flammicorona]|uniref:Uncharacterized protein n=1 Tax=Jimgerdemannia flammicorona TaxID=994334 RepID=A0A433QYY8_9FUNG|nr:hypothetical protein BC938DRAFT_476989 [Jimgerdemannia flammicorona]